MPYCLVWANVPGIRFPKRHFLTRCLLHHFSRYVEEQEIQTSLCSAKGVMVLTTVTANILHTRWDALHIHDFLSLVENMLIFVHACCRMFLLGFMYAQNILSVTAVGQTCQEMV